ncbi:hypothetical protein QO034_18910 [Sedimentitalea sp. JM2-8]|uniref:Uncharacterized protein n=1 Tax=Sedimentitalea xiamensis TaxID=3050037 RepID=A0ABT7FJB5_9RHOB|nr:hypothetical protein [Sedimentitalea xiamensis]MDK3075163.1 hypothetical protein [Sedimentitalea xiamensis]
MPKYKLEIEFDTEDDLRAYLGGETRAAAPAPAEPAREPEAHSPSVAQTKADDGDSDEITDDVDADGLPYDPEIHADPKSFTAKGTWRSKRGKSKEADEARAAFKAAGGAEAAPETTPAATPAMPGMPGAAKAAPAPVSFDQMLDKTLGMMQRGKIDADGVTALYAKLGIPDPSALETNESYRAALFAELCAIEPELA